MSVTFYIKNQQHPVLVYRKEHWNRRTLRTVTATAGGLCSGTVSGWERGGEALVLQLTLPLTDGKLFENSIHTFASCRWFCCDFGNVFCRLIVPHLLIPCCLSHAVVFKISGKWQRIVTMLLGLKRKLRDAKLRSDTQARAASICVWHVQHSTAQLSWGCRWWCAVLRIRNTRIPVVFAFAIAYRLQASRGKWQAQVSVSALYAKSCSEI